MLELIFLGFSSKSLKNNLWFMFVGAEVAQIGRALDSTKDLLRVRLKTELSLVQVRPSAPLRSFISRFSNIC
jgi:hypothetical protein